MKIGIAAEHGGFASAEEIVKAFLNAEFTIAKRYLRRLHKVQLVENSKLINILK